MKTITVNLGDRSYPIIIGTNILNTIGGYLKGKEGCNRSLIVTNPEIGKFYGDTVRESISNESFCTEILTVPEGEKYKTLQTASSLYDFLIKYNYARETIIVALGGGVIGDLTGFVAATYMRGVPFVQVPTSLLAMVDSSVGGKVAVNHPLSKNIIGSFYQPKLVLADIECLKTLPDEELRAGFAEVIKYGMIWDEEFFDFISENIEEIFSLDTNVLEQVVRRSCEIKAKVVEEDEREFEIRTILNYGHTIGHAIESLTNYRIYKHGEAIAIGMVVAARISQYLEMLDEDSVNKQLYLIKKSLLPSIIPPNLDTQDIIERLKKDKKVKGGKVRFVLPEKIGKVVVKNDVDGEIIAKAIDDSR